MTGILLQWIEEYSGLVILTTNNKKQLDEAVLRRLDLWSSCLLFFD